MLLPTRQTVRRRLADLLQDNVIKFTGGFTSESYIVHQLIGPARYEASVRFDDKRPAGREADWYYIRVTQDNGHLAWSSPIWVG
jgi:hypothetical protein